MSATSKVIKKAVVAKNPKAKKDLSSTFNDNLSLPVHRWFKFSAGYSAKWCREVIEREKLNGRTRVLDPFLGSGTTLIESEFAGVESIGIEAHPFISRVAKAKQSWTQDPEKFLELCEQILQKAQKRTSTKTLDNYALIIRKCFPDETLIKLDALKVEVEKFKNKNNPLYELVWLTLVSTLRASSPVGTAQWQYLLPNKVKRSKDPFVAFKEKTTLMHSDMVFRQSSLTIKSKGKIFQEDARKCISVPDKWANLVITSPPYANNYDYADATRLEMSFLGEISGWGDLQETVRKYLIRACTQHVAGFPNELEAVLNDPVLAPIQDEIKNVCALLEKERHLHGGKKAYHAMIAYYFKDLAEVWVALRRVTAPGAVVCFVIGDSAPYGIYVPVEEWLGKLALGAGFKSFEFEKLRDRNIKWKNRKHRVPLKEGRLWVKG